MRFSCAGTFSRGFKDEIPHAKEIMRWSQVQTPSCLLTFQLKTLLDGRFSPCHTHPNKDRNGGKRLNAIRHVTRQDGMYHVRLPAQIVSNTTHTIFLLLRSLAAGSSRRTMANSRVFPKTMNMWKKMFLLFHTHTHARARGVVCVSGLQGVHSGEESAVWQTPGRSQIWLVHVACGRAA